MTARRIHEKTGSPWIDHAGLIGAFLIGTLGVVAIKLLAVGPVLAIAFPVLVLLAYLAICFASGRLQLEPETIGDNCYYLGFLLTLASLSTALYQMRAAGGVAGGEAAIPGILSGFGIALSSTISGVFMRVLLMQMRPDIVTLDREARRDMQAALRDMRANMGTASREFRAMAIEAAQRAAERETEVGKIEGTTRQDIHETLWDIERQRAQREQAILEALKALTAVPVSPRRPEPATEASH